MRRIKVFIFFDCTGFDAGYAKLFGDDEFKPVIFLNPVKKLKDDQVFL
jgi:hypothetical protein